MRRPLTYLAYLSLLGYALAASAHQYVGWQQGPWEQLESKDSVTLYANDETPTDVKAFRADVIVDAPPSEVFKVVLDHDRARRRSFVRRYRVLRDDGVQTLVYQQIARPGLGRREFTARGKIFRPNSAGKGVWGFRWTMDNEAGPDDEDVDELGFTEGSFVLTPIDKGTRTRVSYRALVAPDSWVPDFILNRALRAAAREVADKLRRDAEASND